ncbi:AI-2E family transporter [Wenxinia saemankumensis]|uniref:Predicted PurR-regulated permease PerM n=1 Tax=Wenxinia saemankumensis TaxID=1447782 RepID=A0A1M6FKM0_9RHOB|nr:AI-2E family transporter [Wenxinia saemankumensis]SHI98261.1 Predicted PurR-regulated permease PerM [Wenxinia saemankumensis]
MQTDRLTRDLLFVLAIAALAVAAWTLSFVLLLAFGGTLLAILFRHLALIVSRLTPLPVGAALALVLLGLLAALATLAILAGPRLAAQAAELSDSIPRTLMSIEDRLEDSRWGSWVVEQVQETEPVNELNVMGTLGGTMSAALGALANIVIVLSVGVFLALDPALYRRGLLHLVPPAHRDRAREVLDTLGRDLWRWMAGQALDMAAVAVLTGLGLWLLGIPLPLLLGLIAGLTNFIPFVGPFLSGIPAVLVAFAQSPMDAVWTAALFVAIQQVEGNVLLPMIQSRVASIPPVLILLAVVGAGILFGMAGVLLATPLLLTAIILVRMLYVEDALGDDLGDVDQT